MVLEVFSSLIDSIISWFYWFFYWKPVQTIWVLLLLLVNCTCFVWGLIPKEFLVLPVICDLPFNICYLTKICVYLGQEENMSDIFFYPLFWLTLSYLCSQFLNNFLHHFWCLNNLMWGVLSHQTISTTSNQTLPAPILRAMAWKCNRLSLRNVSSLLFLWIWRKMCWFVSNYCKFRVEIFFSMTCSPGIIWFGDFSVF